MSSAKMFVLDSTTRVAFKKVSELISDKQILKFKTESPQCLVTVTEKLLERIYLA